MNKNQLKIIEETKISISSDSKKIINNALAKDESVSLTVKQHDKFNKTIEEESAIILASSIEVVSQYPETSERDLLPLVLEKIVTNSKSTLARKLAKNSLKFLNKGGYDSWKL